jgi:RNA polymerase sigma-70 factor (ECF subfamily)
VSQEQADFAEFYAGSRDDCLRTVLATVRDVDKAQDLVAEAFARAWASWRRVSRHPAPRAWVVRTALNLSGAAGGLDRCEPAGRQREGHPPGRSYT